MRLGFLVFFAFLGLGCQFRPPPKASVLVLAVEGLDFESVPCLQGAADAPSGLARFCHESVRFTHAYTPSVLSQPALASILSARYPHEHGVRNNGANYLSEKVETLAEFGIRSGYRTAFFSGGPPIWRKSGFAQGFEIFEDNIGIKLGRYYRPAQQNFSLLLNWIGKLRSTEPFFAVTYLPDLQFPLTATRTESGNERSRTRESQLRAVDEAVDELVDALKKANRWDQTYVVVVGLNGQNRRQSLQQISALNLYSENTQVTLMVKPARAQRDLGIEWSVDVNVTLVDLGATLFSLLGSTDFTHFDKNLGVVSFYSALERPSASWHRERVLLSETDWAAWRGIGETRTALRKDHWLILYDAAPTLFNTLVDRIEVNPTNLQNAPTEVQESFQRVIESHSIKKWNSPSEEILQKIYIAKRWFEQKKLPPQELESLLHLIRRRPWDEQVVGWGALHAVQTKNWNFLVELGKVHAKPVWEYIGRRLLGETLNPPADECMVLLFGMAKQSAESCRDRLFKQYAEWLHAADDSEKKYRAAKFLLSYQSRQVQKEISWHNYFNGLAWDTILTIPGEPELLDLVLLLPEYRRPK